MFSSGKLFGGSDSDKVRECPKLPPPMMSPYQETADLCMG